MVPLGVRPTTERFTYLRQLAIHMAHVRVFVTLLQAKDLERLRQLPLGVRITMLAVFQLADHGMGQAHQCRRGPVKPGPDFDDLGEDRLGFRVLRFFDEHAGQALQAAGRRRMERTDGLVPKPKRVTFRRDRFSESPLSRQFFGKRVDRAGNARTARTEHGPVQLQHGARQ
jgi:hypothetical protein